MVQGQKFRGSRYFNVWTTLILVLGGWVWKRSGEKGTDHKREEEIDYKIDSWPPLVAHSLTEPKTPLDRLN